jgi:hypothetical protein
MEKPENFGSGRVSDFSGFLDTLCVRSISQNQYNLTMPKYKKSSTNIKLDH